MIADHGNVRQTLSRLAAPIAAAIVGDQLLGVADTIVIGSLGAVALAAMTGATTIFIALVLTLHGLFQGCGILAAQAVGSSDFDRFGRIVRSSLVGPVLIATAITLASFALARPAMHVLIGPLPTLQAGATYLVLRCCSLVPIAISSLAYTAFGAASDTRFGVKLLGVVNAVHIPLLLILALGWGTHHALGIVGAGVSSLVAEIAGATFSLVAAARRPALRIFARTGVDWTLALRTLWLGLPEAAYLFLIMAPDIAIVGLLAPLGAETVASFRVLVLVADLAWAIPGSLGSAAQTVIGQRFGADDNAGAQAFERRAQRYGVTVSAVGGVAIAILAWPIGLLVTLDPALASLAALPLVLHMTTLPLKGYAMMGIARIRAAGDTRFSMLAGLLASGIVLPGVWAGINVLHLGLFAVPCAWIVAWCVWCGATALRLHRFDWDAARLAA
jgi:MATE family multidrug resistance protein